MLGIPAGQVLKMILRPATSPKSVLPIVDLQADTPFHLFPRYVAGALLARRRPPGLLNAVVVIIP